MKIVEYLKPELIIENIGAKNKKEALEEFSRCIERVLGLKAEKILHVLIEREKLGSTGIGEGVAIPHGKLHELEQLVCCFGRSREGIDFEAIDGKPVHLVFLLLAPENSAGTHLKALAKISKILKDPAFREQLIQAADAEEIYRIIKEEDDKL
ncbi:MAG: PTS sugar transporter subunit IIA [Deltaproteobacteria bacterium]|nr:MAG: PTS sugar transporter subunit IIA [Deltaproteobacteria bacterium]